MEKIIVPRRLYNLLLGVGVRTPYRALFSSSEMVSHNKPKFEYDCTTVNTEYSTISTKELFSVG
jgi:hypothetical protein